MSQKRYTVACLAGHGIGPEVMAQACRVVDAASRLHGFVVDGQHVPFAAEALMRFGHPFPPSSRRAVLEAAAVLVPSRGPELLEALEDELDVCASVERVRFPEGTELTVLAPLRDDAWDWTLERAFALARDSRARVAFVGLDTRRSEVASHVEARHDGLEVSTSRSGTPSTRWSSRPSASTSSSVPPSTRTTAPRSPPVSRTAASSPGAGSRRKGRASSAPRMAPHTTSPAKTSRTRARCCLQPR